MADLGADCRNGRYKTICHGGCNHNLVYYPDSNLFQCYSCCGTMNVIDLVMKANSWDYAKAIRFLCDRFGISYKSREGFTPVTQDLGNCYDLANLCDHGMIRAEEEKDEAILNYFDRSTFYKGWIDEGISIETMQRFGIEWFDYRKWIIIPVRNMAGKLIGIRRRSLNVEECKYMPVFGSGLGDYSFRTGAALYGIYENQNVIRKRRLCYLFEGEKSVLKCATWYGDFPCAACYTHSVSSLQIDLLMQLRVSRVVICFDYDGGDEREAYQKLCAKVNASGIQCTYLYDGYDDYLEEHEAPADKGRAVFETLLKRKYR